ncbi:RNA pseudouridylate synthase domain containing protein 2, partial [Tyrophagus putrescentiae]
AGYLLGVIKKLPQYYTCSSFRTLFTSSIKVSSAMSAEKRELESSENDAESTSLLDQKSKRLKRNNQFVETPLDVSDYYIENGLRKVYPYEFTFQSYCKGRWVGRKLSELFEQEFRAVTEDIMKKRCQTGLLKVNGQMVEPDYILKDNDFITNRIHRHEFPVLAAPIPIIHKDKDFLVIDKPPSLPIHPCGKYRLNAITSLLEKENGIKDIHVIHRLDRLTSGVLIMALSKAKAQKLHQEMRNREMHKEYVCRVEGKFPDGVTEVDQPIETIAHKIGICIVSPTGKPSKTFFERLNYNGKSSTVLCKPMTGRMHQIRVHLQYIGYPIMNDNFYNSPSFGPNKGKGGDFGKSIEELIAAIGDEHLRSKHLLSNEKDTTAIEDSRVAERNDLALKAMEHYTSQESWQETKKRYKHDPAKDSTQADCTECKEPTCDPMPCEQFIYLHALRYKSTEWSFETQVPIWAKETWTYD